MHSLQALPGRTLHTNLVLAATTTAMITTTTTTTTTTTATYYLLPTTYYLLPPTYYLLPTTYYLLPTTYATTTTTTTQTPQKGYYSTYFSVQVLLLPARLTSYRHGQCRVAACGPGPLRWPTAAGTLTPLSSKCDVSAVWAVSWACVLRILVQGLGFRIRGLGFKISGVRL